MFTLNQIAFCGTTENKPLDFKSHGKQLFRSMLEIMENLDVTIFGLVKNSWEQPIISNFFYFHKQVIKHTLINYKPSVDTIIYKKN